MVLNKHYYILCNLLHKGNTLQYTSVPLIFLLTFPALISCRPYPIRCHHQLLEGEEMRREKEERTKDESGERPLVDPDPHGTPPRSP